MFRRFSIFFILAPIVALGPVAAQEATNLEDHIPLLNEEQKAKLDQAHEDASQWLLNTAIWFDSFFDDENYSSEVNKTRVKASLSVGYSKKDDLELKPRASLRLRLPKLSKKANLLISASDDSEFSAEETPLTDIPLHEDSERNELTATLQYFLREKVNNNISLRFGLSWDYVYAGLRYRLSHDLGKWRSRFINDLRYYTDDGWENKSSLQFDRLLSEHWLFRMTLAAEWFEQENGVPHSLSFRTYQLLDRKRAFEYDVAGYFDSRPDYSLTDVQLKVTFRQRFYRDWLALEISPFVTFPEDYDREANPGIVFKLEIEFGYISDETKFPSIFNL